jgi:major membrane immunogen (membrane-anchored lipoprotein)
MDKLCLSYTDSDVGLFLMKIQSLLIKMSCGSPKLQNCPYVPAPFNFETPVLTNGDLIGHVQNFDYESSWSAYMKSEIPCSCKYITSVCERNIYMTL